MTILKEKKTLFFLVLFLVQNVFNEEIQTEDEENRQKKVLPIFQVVRFPNDACEGSSKNGTCYTSEECSNRGGTNQGSCASGFGICCSFTLGCGDSAAENNSYIEQSSVTSLSTNPCKYNICPCQSNICRIRYDFSTFEIASAPTQTIAAEASNGVDNGAFSTGQCVTDAFNIASPGNIGTPTICGTNTGYHMIVDSDGSACQEVNFNIGTTTTTTRQWTIRVTQYDCSSEEIAGPPGCLQYYTQTANTIENFGFPTSGTSTTTTTHLADQHYDICIRRASGYCYICYSPSQTANPASFGLSVSPGNTDAAGSDTPCSTDYIEIPYAESATNAAINPTASLAATAVANRLCGRRLNFNAIADASITICSKQKPFRVGVHFDGNEVCTATEAANTCEWDSASAGEPGGHTGFKLIYWQNTC